MPEEYLPDALRGQRFYEPSENGEEARIAERLSRWREEQEKRRSEDEQRQAATDQAARKLQGPD